MLLTSSTSTANIFSGDVGARYLAARLRDRRRKPVVVTPTSLWSVDGPVFVGTSWHLPTEASSGGKPALASSGSPEGAELLVTFLLSEVKTVNEGLSTVTDSEPHRWFLNV